MLFCRRVAQNEAQGNTTYIRFSINLGLLAEIGCDQTELFESIFEVFHNVLGDDVGTGKVIGGFEGFVFEPEDVKAGFVAGVEMYDGKTDPVFIPFHRINWTSMFPLLRIGSENALSSVTKCEGS